MSSCRGFETAETLPLFYYQFFLQPTTRQSVSSWGSVQADDKKHDWAETPLRMTSGLEIEAHVPRYVHDGPLP